MAHAELVAAGGNKYHFNLLGIVKELVYPNKAIIHFKLNGKEERALLLSKMFYISAKPLDEIMTARQSISDFLKINDILQFDCHIYDKGGMGSGKDKCNFFAMKACKQNDQVVQHDNLTKTGWVSEIYPQVHTHVTYPSYCRT